MHETIESIVQDLFMFDIHRNFSERKNAKKIIQIYLSSAQDNFKKGR